MDLEIKSRELRILASEMRCSGVFSKMMPIPKIAMFLILGSEWLQNCVKRLMT